MQPQSLATMSNGELGAVAVVSTAVSNDVRKKSSQSHPKAPASNPRMEEFLKTWRQDALNKHQYDAAIFIGDKLLALTGMYVYFGSRLACCVNAAKATPRMRSGSRRSTLVPGTTTVRRRSSRGTI